MSKMKKKKGEEKVSGKSVDKKLCVLSFDFIVELCKKWYRRREIEAMNRGIQFSIDTHSSFKRKKGEKKSRRVKNKTNFSTLAHTYTKHSVMEKDKVNI